MLAVSVKFSFSAMLVCEATSVIVGSFVFSMVSVICCSPFSVALVTVSIAIMMVSSYSTSASAITVIIAVALKEPAGITIVAAAVTYQFVVAASFVPVQSIAGGRHLPSPLPLPMSKHVNIAYKT